MKLKIFSTLKKGRKVAAGLGILNLPTSGKQRILKDTLNRFGEFFTVAPDAITAHTVDGDVTFRICQAPGRHCLTCGEKLPGFGSTAQDDAANIAACGAHIAEHEAAGDKVSRSKRWPHGYMVLASSYLCEVLPSDLANEKMAQKGGLLHD